jgi:hypothetical protein
LPLRLIGIGPRSSVVQVDDEMLDIRFGVWRVRTPLDNIAGVRITGPYNPLTALGIRIGLRDRGLTFGTSVGPGVCITFHEPVATSAPTLLIRHPGLTVTVEDPQGLATALVRTAGDAVDRDDVDDEVVHLVEQLEQVEQRRLRQEAQRRQRELQEAEQEQREQQKAQEQSRERARQRRAAREAAETASTRAARTSTRAPRKQTAKTSTASAPKVAKRTSTRTPARRSDARKAPAARS